MPSRQLQITRSFELLPELDRISADTGFNRLIAENKERQEETERVRCPHPTNLRNLQGATQNFMSWIPSIRTQGTLQLYHRESEPDNGRHPRHEAG